MMKGTRSKPYKGDPLLELLMGRKCKCNTPITPVRASTKISGLLKIESGTALSRAQLGDVLLSSTLPNNLNKCKARESPYIWRAGYMVCVRECVCVCVRVCDVCTVLHVASSE